MIGTSFSTPEQVQALLDLLKTLGVDRIDTAARYSPTAPGSSERLLGETRAAEHGFTIDTKINTASGAGAGTLTATAIEKSLQESLSRLHMSKVKFCTSIGLILRLRLSSRRPRFIGNILLVALIRYTKYKTPEMHTAMTDLLDTLEPLGIAGSEACIRWLYYHSALSEEDGVILGASKMPQIVQNMTDISKGPLPTEVLQKIDSLWEKVY